MKSNISICFKTPKRDHRFLFQVLNIGKNSEDDLKFIFSNPSSRTGCTYMQNPDRYGRGDLIRLIAEVSYHNDGSLLFKLPSYNARTSIEYRNPQGTGFRRTPLNKIGQWEGILSYTIFNYELCKKKNISNAMLVNVDELWFDGTPFECQIFLGSKLCPTPIASQQFKVERIKCVSTSIDLCIIISKIAKSGHLMRMGNTDMLVLSTNNVVDIIPTRSYVDGA